MRTNVIINRQRLRRIRFHEKWKLRKTLDELLAQLPEFPVSERAPTVASLK
jgi:hypothetical protein